MLKLLTTGVRLAAAATMIAYLALSAVTTASAQSAGPGSAAEWGRFYAEIYGGMRAPGSASFTGDEPTESFALSSGPVFGGAGGISTSIEGLSVGIDVMHTHAIFDQFPLFDLDTMSIMATAELAYRLGDRFDIYGSGGLGMTNVVYTDHDPADHDDEPYAAWVPSYEVAAGARVHVTPTLSLFTEVKHLDLLAPATLSLDDGPTSVGVSHNSLLAGVRFSY